MSGVGQAVFMNQRSFGPPPGQEAFTTAGTFTFVVPAGVTSVSAVAVGAGRYNGDGGVAGSLGYKNNVNVTPGSSHTVVVGAGGTGSGNGGDSTFINACTLKGGGGSFSGGQSFVGDGGGLGGIRGGGAGGYSGNGGNGPSTFTSGTAGAGGGGGGSGKAIISAPDRCGCGFGSAGGGGGVGILGEGSSGAGGSGGGTGSTAGGGGGGSGGTSGGSVSPNSNFFCSPAVPAGVHGGGAGDYGCGARAPGGGGAVRIIFPGCARSFPSTRTGDE